MYRVAIFIDGGYLAKILEHEFNNKRVAYGDLSQAIARTIHPDADILRTYYYHCLPYQSNPPTVEERERFAHMQNFFKAISYLPRFVLREGRLARRGPDQNGQYTFEQKMIDMLLSIDLVRLSTKNQITHAALVTGDSDFVPAIEVAKEEGISVWLFHGGRLHNTLQCAADERVRFTKPFIDSVLFNPKPSENHGA